jgi:YHS domain-containing protein
MPMPLLPLVGSGLLAGLLIGLGDQQIAADLAGSQNLRRVIEDDGEDPAAATLEQISWPGPSDASTRVALLSGRYKIYASGDVAEESISIKVTDVGTREVLGSYVLSGQLPPVIGILTLKTASICSITAVPMRPELRRVGSRYAVVVGLVRHVPSSPSVDEATGLLQSGNHSRMEHATLGIDTPASMQREIDPVCGMKVDRSAARAIHDGKTYYFCSEEDRQEFVSQPGKFIKRD